MARLLIALHLLLVVGVTLSAFTALTSNPANTLSAADEFPPAAVSGLAATSGQDGQVPLSWSAANRAVDYEIQYRVVGAPSWETPTVTTALTSTTVTGLANGSTYEFQIRATNTGGVSAWSASVTATPAGSGPPGVPTGVTATSGEWAQTVVTWSSVSGATSYTVQYRVQGAWTTRSAVAGTTDTITGLPDGTPYEVQVKASNASGDSAWAPGSPATATTGSWAQISTGANHTCGVTTTGRAYCWGSDTVAQVGNGAITGNQTTPNAVDTTTGLTTTNVATISASGLHTCVVTTAGRAYCWGDDNYGELGNGATAIDQVSPAAVDTTTGLTTTNVASITAGGNETCAVTTTGQAYCWGSDGNGQLGNGATTGNQVSPSAVDTTTGLTTTNVAQMTGGGFHTCARTTTGRAYCWGYDLHGQVGNGATTGDQASPNAVDTTTGLTTTNVATIDAGEAQTCARTTTGRAYCWGYDSTGQLGNGATTGDQASPNAVDTSTGLTTTNVAQIAAGGYHACAITNGSAAPGKVYCWGSDGNGELGNGATLTADQPSPSPVLAPPLTPTGVSATGGLYAYVPVSWSSVPGATSYTVQYRLQGAGSWTTRSAVTATSDNVTGLTNGSTYEFQVKATNAAGDSAWSSTVTATPSASGAPAPPGGVTAPSGVPGQVSVSWTSVSGATTYTVQYRAQGTSTWTARSALAGTTDTVTGLTNGSTYEFQVKATNAVGDSAWSATVTATPLAPPATPTGLAATSGNPGQVPLSWNASSGATSYTVQYRTGAGSWTAWDSVTGTSLTVTGLGNGTTYDFQVQATNATGSSAWSATVTATPAAVTAPTLPVGAQTGFNNSTSAASFSVTAPSGLVNGDMLVAALVTVKTATTPSVSTCCWNAGPTATSAGSNKIWTFYKTVTDASSEPASYLFSWTGNARGIGSIMRVSGADTVETSSTNASTGAGSNLVSMTSLTTLGPNRLLLAMAGVDGKPTLSNTTGITNSLYDLNDGNGGGTHYTAEGGSDVQLTAGASGVISFNYGTAQQWSSVLLAIAPPSLPVTPGGLSATGGRYAHVPLSWSSVTGATSYQVRYRVNGSGAWTQSATQSGTSLTVTGLTNGTTYEFQVKASSNLGESVWSSSVTATPSAAGTPMAPSGVTATSGLSGQVPVSWSASAGATSYTVQYRVQGAGSWTTRSAVAGTSDTVTGLTDFTTYEFQVKATNGGGDSAWSPGTPLTATPAAWAQISTDTVHTCALTAGGKAYCWGSDSSGQLGNGAALTANQESPSAVDTTTGLTTTNVAAISVGHSHTCALTTAGRAYCWGDDSNGRLGNGAALTANQESPSAVDTTTGLTTTNVARLSAGDDGSCAVTTAGRAYCWGIDGAYGQLGNGAGLTADQESPSAVDTTTNVATVSVGSGGACAITTAGKAYCWGYNGTGELGTGVAGNQDKPAAVATTTGLTDTNVAQIDANSYTCAVTTAGKAYCWGQDGNGELGNGATTGNQFSPSAVDTTTGLTNTNVARIDAGVSQTCAVTTAGKAYCWGQDTYGQLGNGATTGNQVSPSAVDTTTGLTNTNVAQITSGWRNSCALTTSGRAYCWGNDTYGQLGNGAAVTADQPSPMATS